MNIKNKGGLSCLTSAQERMYNTSNEMMLSALSKETLEEYGLYKERIGEILDI